MPAIHFVRRATSVALALTMTVASATGAQLALGREVRPTRPPTVDGIDLVPTSITLNANNQVAFTMTNVGRSAVAQPFVSDIYINGMRKDTYKHTPQPAQSDVAAVSTLARVDSCGSVTIKIVSDAQQVVAEANENNNTQIATLTPRCPDLAIAEIKQDWQDYNTRYRIQIKVVNQGNAPMQRSALARAWGGPSGEVSGLDLGAWPIRTDVEVKPLVPGESTTFHVSGTFLGTDAVLVKVYLDFYHQIVEKRVDNNLGSKQFGPH